MPYWDIILTCSFGINFVIAFWGLISSKQPISLAKVFWVFQLVFMVIVPYMQLLSGQFPWGRSFSPMLLLQLNLIVLFVQLFILFFIRKKTVLEKQHSNPFTTLTIHSTYAKLMFICSALLLIWGNNHFYFWQYKNGFYLSNSSLQLLVDKTLKGLCLASSLALVICFRQQKIRTSVAFLFLLLALMANFPSAQPRYWLACYYGALAFVFYYDKIVRWKHAFETLLISALLGLFPILTLFKFSNEKLATLDVKKFIQLTYLGGDFDSYSALGTTLQYVQQYGLCWGRQLLGVLLFFIPRSIWPDKPIGTGAMVNRLEGSDFTNFSCPFIAEFYINFGLLGILLAVAILAIVIRKYDVYFWYSSAYSKTKLFLFYPSACFLLFFMLRGDLLSSFAYTLGIGLSFALALQLMIKK